MHFATCTCTARYRDACLDVEDAKAAEVLAEESLRSVMAGANGGLADPDILQRLNQANERVSISI